MANIYKSNNKATVCSGNTCVTVYGKAARAIELIVVTTIAVIAIVMVAKVLK